MHLPIFGCTKYSTSNSILCVMFFFKSIAYPAWDTKHNEWKIKNIIGHMVWFASLLLSSMLSFTSLEKGKSKIRPRCYLVGKQNWVSGKSDGKRNGKSHLQRSHVNFWANFKFHGVNFCFSQFKILKRHHWCLISQILAQLGIRISSIPNGCFF